MLLPKFGFDSEPNSFSCGIRSLFRSAHGRVAVFTVVRNGFRSFLIPTLCSSATYRLTVAFTAVLPVPNRSYATPSLGLRSFQFGTSGTASNDRGPIQRPPSADCAFTRQFR